MNKINTNKLLDLSGKKAIVTGGAVGIGFGISYRLAEAGAKVLVADINQENIDLAKSKLNDRQFDVEYIQADVSSAEDVNKIVQSAMDKLGGIDILVNNAGIYPPKLLMDMDVADFDKVLSVNLKSAMMMTKAAAEKMISQNKGGNVINITSIDALHPSSPGLAHYDASKHGMWGFTKNIALELAQHNIKVNAVAPGGITTPGTESMGQDSKILEEFTARIPMKRTGDIDEIGKAVLFLSSDMASYMTGSQIVVDGGVLLS